MSQHTRFSTKTSTGEAAAEGLLRGMVAGVAMLASLLLAGLVMGGTQWEAVLAISPLLDGSDLAALPLSGIFTHLAVASFYGLLWGPAWRWIKQYSALPAWMAGMAYGIILFVLAQSLAQALPLSLQQMDGSTILAAHAVYGFVLGGLSR